MSKFDRLPVEEDTTVLLRVQTQIGGYDALYEVWLWDNIQAYSAIFVSGEVAELGEDRLTELVREQFSLEPDASTTYSKDDDGYTFVNFGFKVVEGC